jgi:hypothetical protein
MNKKNQFHYFYIFLAIIIIIFILFVFYYSFKNIEGMNADNITVVSGYWPVKNKYGNNKYDEWFKKSLKINQRYIFFCEKDRNDYIKSFRGDLETIFVDYPISDFYCNKYASDKWIDSTHVPSKEVGMIWNEKMHMLKMAKNMDETPTDYYIWIDAGIAPYREIEPPSVRLNLKDLESLPKDKLCYSHVNEDYHNFAATCLLIHRDAIDIFHDKYYEFLSECNDGWKCGSDQYIFTKMMNKYPDMFYKMSEGYGENLIELYENYI